MPLQHSWAPTQISTPTRQRGDETNRIVIKLASYSLILIWRIGSKYVWRLVCRRDDEVLKLGSLFAGVGAKKISVLIGCRERYMTCKYPAGYLWSICRL